MIKNAWMFHKYKLITRQTSVVMVINTSKWIRTEFRLVVIWLRSQKTHWTNNIFNELWGKNCLLSSNFRTLKINPNLIIFCKPILDIWIIYTVNVWNLNEYGFQTTKYSFFQIILDFRHFFKSEIYCVYND